MAGSVFGRALGSISCSPLHVGSAGRRRGRPADPCSDTRWRRYQVPSRTRTATGSCSELQAIYRPTREVVSRSGTHPPMRQMLRTEPHQAIARRHNAQVRWDTPSGPLHAYELAAAPPRTESEAQPAAFGTAHGQILTSLPAKTLSKWRSGKPRPPHQSPTLHSQKQIADARDEMQQCRAMQRDRTANRFKVGQTVCGMAVPARYIPAAPAP